MLSDFSVEYLTSEFDILKKIEYLRIKIENFHINYL